MTIQEIKTNIDDIKSKIMWNEYNTKAYNELVSRSERNKQGNEQQLIVLQDELLKAKEEPNLK